MGLLLLYDAYRGLVGLVVLWLVLWLLLRRRLPWAGALVLLVVMGLAAVPVALESRAIRADVAAMAPAERRVLPADLPPGRVLVLHGDGILCPWTCEALAAAPWAVSVTEDDRALTTGDFVVFDDVYLQDLLWPRLPREQVVPYDYLVLAMSVYRLPGLPEGAGYATDWPDTLQNVVILLRLPPDGKIDLEGQGVLYRRFAHMHFVSRYPLWPGGLHYVDTPPAQEILADLIGRPAGEI